ncbi:hypothetical protein Tco_0702820 [Tanacetum coccineum]|uniref:Xylulose kinase-1 n=1 Tax=Tanacetum coccineum TaxID=301880 RepID=A0ABQ4XX26_9ASTR
MVAYLEKLEGSEGFHEIINFLSASHIHYALNASPTIYTSLIEQFWQTAALCTIDDGVLGITATINRKVKITVSEASIRRHLKLEDSEGISYLPTAEIFKQFALMGSFSSREEVFLGVLVGSREVCVCGVVRMIVRGIWNGVLDMEWCVG